MASSAIPVSLLTGFLGSGKTTVLNALLRHPDMVETAVIINEFGDIGLDHLLVEATTEETILLNSGCLCCMIREDLASALTTLHQRREAGTIPPFQRVVIETTGLADPAPILHTLMTNPAIGATFRLDGVIATVDAVNGAETLLRQDEAIKQIAVADRILLTKTDLAPTSDLLEILRRINPAAPRLMVTQGSVDPSQLFDASLYDGKTGTFQVLRWLKAETYGSSDGDEHSHFHEPNRHGADIHAYCCTLDTPVAAETWNVWLSMMLTFRGPDFLRVKGMLNVAGQSGPMVVHGVQHIFHPPVLLADWPSEDQRSRVVFITRNISQADLAEAWNILKESAT